MFESSSSFQMKVAILFVTTYAIPMSAFFFYGEKYNKWCALATMISALPVNVFFVYAESIQMMKSGIMDHMSDFFNVNDILGLFIYPLYSILVLNNQFGKGKLNLDLLNVIMIIQIMLKIQFFLRVSKKFGLLVTLIQTCFRDVAHFVTYLFIWMITMSLLYKVLGFSTATTGYEQIADGTFTNFFLQVFENSIGNISPPTFVEKHPSNLRVFGVYTTWFTNQFVVLIILLNFLIAVISQSYENVMNSQSILTYLSRCEWNKEMYQMP